MVVRQEKQFQCLAAVFASLNMPCAYPVPIGNGLIVPCGKCYYCRMQKRASWVFRMQQELKELPNAVFVTFTYDDYYIKQLRNRFDRRHIGRLKKKYGDFETATLEPKHVTELLKRSQKLIKKNCGDDFLLRYYITGEYGDMTNRPHLHGIFYFPKNFSGDIELFFKQIWHYGNIDIQDVTPANINYIAKHQVKDCKGNAYQQKWSPIFSRMSRYNGGIGKDFLSNVNVKRFYLQNKYQNSYVILNGYKIPLPSFYRKKLFDKMSGDDFLRLLKQQHDNIAACGDFAQYLRKLRQEDKKKWSRLAILKRTRKFVKNITKNL